MIKSSLGEERVYLAYRSQAVKKSGQPPEEEREQDPWLKPAHSLSDSCLADFLIHAG